MTGSSKTPEPPKQGAAGATELPQVALGDGSFARRLWESTRALAWVEDEAGRVSHCDARCHLSSPLAGSAAAASPEDVLRGLEAARRSGPATGVAAGSDGDGRHFLVVRFPFRCGERGCLGHVALDITQQQGRLDELLHPAVEDDLTGLYNRRGFLLFAEHELRAARRHRTRPALVFVDIDGLKAVNDRHGRGRGDAVLVETARLLRDVFRECNVIARFGGDEFAVLATDVRGDPEALRERLRARLAGWRDASDAARELRISAGLASSEVGQSKALAQLLTEADVAMYADKAAKDRPL